MCVSASGGIAALMALLNARNPAPFEVAFCMALQGSLLSVLYVCASTLRVYRSQHAVVFIAEFPSVHCFGPGHRCHSQRKHSCLCFRLCPLLIVFVVCLQTSSFNTATSVGSSAQPVLASWLSSLLGEPRHNATSTSAEVPNVSLRCCVLSCCVFFCVLLVSSQSLIVFQVGVTNITLCQAIPRPPPPPQQLQSVDDIASAFDLDLATSDNLVGVLNVGESMPLANGNEHERGRRETTTKQFGVGSHPRRGLFRKNVTRAA